MRGVALALFVLLVAGVLWMRANDKEPPPEVPDGPGPQLPVSGKWAKTPLPNMPLDVWLPVEFTLDPQQVGDHGWLFRGPADEGFRPSIHLYRRPWKKERQAFFTYWSQKFRDESGRFWKFLEEGEATVAGLPGWFIVYEQIQPDARCLTIDWLFVRDGHGFILRGAASPPTFKTLYRRIFTEAAARLRLRG